MNKHIVTLACGCALLAACSNSDDIVPANPAKAGEAITFAVGKTTTRTEYLDRLQIGWTNGDLIGVYSNDVGYGENTNKQAVYTVNGSDDEGHDGHGTLEAADEATLVWGETDPCTFLSAYPQGRITRYPNETDHTNRFDMRYMTNQMVEVTSSIDGKYMTKPDMLNAYMMAKKTVSRTNDHILLSFDPIMTTLEINITAGGYHIGTGIIQPLTITGVSVIMPRRVETTTDGAFTYNLSAMPAAKGTLEGVAAGTESVYVGFKNGSKYYVDLSEGETVNLMAFLPPIPANEMKGSKIKVHTAEGFKFNINIPDENLLSQQSRIDIKLPDVTVNADVQNNWMGQLDQSLEVASLTIPGDKCSEWMQSEMSDDNVRKRTMSLLNQGVRAFFVASTDGGKYKVFADALVDWIGSHQSEFVIILDNRTSTQGNASAVATTIHDYSLLYNGWVNEWGVLGHVSSFNTNLTLSDVAGKVALINDGTSNGANDHMYCVNDNGTWAFTDYRLDGMVKTVAGTSLTDSSDPDNPEGQWRFTVLGDANQANYETLAASDAQTGGYGIVFVPNGGDTKGYGNLLTQSLIACNFKFQLKR